MRNRTLKRMHRIRSVLELRQKDLTLVLANIHDPHNVSAILRSCDAFGVPLVHLYYTNEVFPKPGGKSSASARKWVDLERHDDARTMVRGLRQKGYQIFCADLDKNAVSISDCDFTKPTAIVLGNEHRGVDSEILDLVPDRVCIPMQGMIQSLNVSVAAAVFLYEAWRQRTAKGMYAEPSFDPRTLENMIEDWSRR